MDGFGDQMAEIINLRGVRKRRSREEKALTAAENRVRFGLTKAQKQAEMEDARQQSARQDGHKLDRKPVDDG